MKAGVRAHLKEKPWGVVGYGYRRTDDGEWEPDPTEGAIVERMFRESSEQGRSYNGIARALNADGIPPRKGRKWVANVVRRTLGGRYVLGYYKAGGKWVKGNHPAIVSEDLWLAAQVSAERGRKFAPGGGRLPTRHLFVRGMLRCGLCGEAMLPRSEATDTYTCRTRRTGGPEACPMPVMRRADLDARAYELFSGYALDWEATRENVLANANARASELDGLIETAERALATAQAQRAKVQRDYRAGKLKAELYQAEVDDLDGQVQAAEAERDRLTANLAAVHEVPQAFGEADLASGP